MPSLRRPVLVVSAIVAVASCGGDSPSGPSDDAPTTGSPPAGSEWRGLTVNGGNSCALNAVGTAFCWGLNRTAPVAISGGVKFVSITAGSLHGCGLTAGGSAYCWLVDYFGSAGASSSAQPIPGGLTFTTLVAGGSRTCGLTGAGEAYCWVFGEGGNSTDPGRLPEAVPGGRTYKAIAFGYSHVCALTMDGSAYCWGDGQLGRLGDGTRSFGWRATPGRVLGGHTFSSISAGADHTCALRDDGAAFCWGGGTFGKIGDGLGGGERGEPSAVVGGQRFASISAGGHHTCGVARTGAVYCWGYNLHGQFGNGAFSGASQASPVVSASGVTFAAVHAGYNHTCGATSGGALYCWGTNSDGELGDGTTRGRNVPTRLRNP